MILPIGIFLASILEYPFFFRDLITDPSAGINKHLTVRLIRGQGEDGSEQGKEQKGKTEAERHGESDRERQRESLPNKKTFFE